MPESEWVVRKVPHLQIVDDEFWERAQLRGRAGSDQSRNGGNRVPHPLTAVLACAACGGTIRVQGGRGYACKRRYDRRGCDNGMRIGVRRTEDRALRAKPTCSSICRAAHPPTQLQGGAEWRGRGVQMLRERLQKRQRPVRGGRNVGKEGTERRIAHGEKNSERANAAQRVPGRSYGISE